MQNFEKKKNATFWDVTWTKLKSFLFFSLDSDNVNDSTLILQIIKNCHIEEIGKVIKTGCYELINSQNTGFSGSLSFLKPVACF